MVVATRNRPGALREALAAIGRSSPPHTETIVVDSAGDDASARTVAAEAGVRYVRVDEPGLARARNHGIAATGAEVVIFTDDDCRPEPGWTAPLLAAFDTPDVGFVTGEVVGPGEGTAADVTGIGPQAWRWPDDPVGMGSGANMAVRRSAVERIGGFDVGLGAGAEVPSAEDHELFLRLLHAGFEGRHAPGSVVAHLDDRGRWATIKLFYRYGLGSGTICARARDLDRAVAARMLRRRLGHDGVRRVMADLRRGWEIPALRGAAMTLGVAVGWSRARFGGVSRGSGRPRAS